LDRIFVNLSKVKAMRDPVTEDELARARTDPAFRQQFLAQNLDRLLEALKRMRLAVDQNDETARQIQEGADLAVMLADRLQRNDSGSTAA
jgi:DNA-binding transcriptional LysR family regulator